MFYFHSYLGMISILTNMFIYFSIGLKPPTRILLCHSQQMVTLRKSCSVSVVFWGGVPIILELQCRCPTPPLEMYLCFKTLTWFTPPKVASGNLSYKPDVFPSDAGPWPPGMRWYEMIHFDRPIYHCLRQCQWVSPYFRSCLVVLVGTLCDQLTLSFSGMSN